MPIKKNNTRIVERDKYVSCIALIPKAVHPLMTYMAKIHDLSLQKYVGSLLQKRAISHGLEYTDNENSLQCTINVSDAIRNDIEQSRAYYADWFFKQVGEDKRQDCQGAIEELINDILIEG